MIDPTADTSAAPDQAGVTDLLGTDPTQSSDVDPGPVKPKPTKPLAHVMTRAEWEAAQSAPVAAVTSDDPAAATTNGYGRPLTRAEWEQSQRMSPQQIQDWKIPAIPAVARDITRTPADPNAPGHQIPGVVGEIVRRTVDPALEHPVMTAGLLAAGVPGVAEALPALGVVAKIAGAMFAAPLVYHIAQFGWQFAAEHSLDPETRAIIAKDPEYQASRISSAAAAAQAIILGIGPLAHFGVKGVNSLTDFSDGMTEAGAEGLKESNFAPRFSEGFSAGQARSDFATKIEDGKAEAAGASTNVPAPKGFEPTAAPPQRARSTQAEGLVVPETTKPGRIKPIETEPASAPLQDAADLNAAVREHQAQRVAQDTQDIADERTAAAERLLGLREDDAARVEQETTQLVRRRPGGVKPANETPFFETPGGANVLGSMAARKGLPDDASPYPPTSRLDVEWKAGHDAVTSEAAGAPATMPTPTYPEGFTMGGGLTDNRIPEIPERGGRRLSSIGKGPGQYVDRETERALTQGPEATTPAPPPLEPNDQSAGAAASTEGGAASPRARVPRPGTTLSDDPRYDSGARRPLHLVSVRGLVKELVDLEDKRADAAGRSIYRVVEHQDATDTAFGTRLAATRGRGGVSEQAKALQNLEDYARIDHEVTQHLIEQRGIPADVVDELLARERAERYDRAAAEEGGGADADFNFGANETPKAANPLETVRGAEETLEQLRLDADRRSKDRLARTDDKTGLGNDRAYRESLDAAEANPKIKIIRLDLNGMKLTNDAFGHLEGDRLLQRVAEIIRQHAPGLPAFRVGGDEFAVFAPADQAEAIRDAIEANVGVGEVAGPHYETGEPATAKQSISGGVGDTDLEADAAAKVRKTMHKAEQRFPEASGRETTGHGLGNGLSPVEGSGDMRTRGLASGVQQKALANRLEIGVGDLPEYRQLNMADQATRATQLLADDPELAARVARGDARAPHGLLPESVFVAVEQRAIEQGDVNTLRDLATSRLTGEATTMGQRIRALAERDPESPVAAIQDVVNTRSGGAKNAAAVAKSLDEEVRAMTGHLEGVRVHGNAWNHFIEAIKC